MRISKPAGEPSADLPAVQSIVTDRVNKTGEPTSDRAIAGLIDHPHTRGARGERAIDVEMKARMAACIALSSEKMSASEIAAALNLSKEQVHYALARARKEMSREQAFVDAVERMDRDIVPLAVDRLHEKVTEGKRWAIQDVLFGRRVLVKQEAKNGGGGGAAAPGGGGPIVQINIMPNPKRPDVALGTVVGQALGDEGEVIEGIAINVLPSATSS